MNKNIILIIVLVLIGGAIWYLESTKPSTSNSSPEDIILPVENRATSTKPVSTTSKPDRSAIIAEKAKKYPRAKELADIQGYINMTDFKLKDLVGKKVILIDFWTYSCINCQRTTPYLNAWYDKYKDDGFVIIGVHTPEFEFEKDYNNVEMAVEKEGIKYPVVLDNDMGTWNAYGNRYWPRKYLIDIDGFIVYDHAGEGSYEETEQKIQAALKERKEVLGDTVKISDTIVKSGVNDVQPESPETYFGSSRNEFLGNGTPGRSGEQNFSEPLAVVPNKLYLIGQWNIQSEFAETSASVGNSQAGSDRIDYRYKSKRVYLVAGSPTRSIDVEVLRDSKPIDSTVKGADIFYKYGKSYVKIQENRLYKIIEDTAKGDHLLEFIISNPGLQAFTFTFG